MKFNLSKITSTVLLILILTLFAVTPSIAPQGELLAQGGETPYGGLNAVQIVCVCSVNILVYLLDYANNSQLLSLVYQPGASTLYEYFDPFGRYLLGTYMQGSGQCQIYVGVECIDLDSDGQMGTQPGTGTSL